MSTLRMSEHRVYLMGELPRFGSGWRTVIVEQIGAKWVHLRVPSKTRGTKIRHEEWVDILSHTARMSNRNTSGGNP